MSPYTHYTGTTATFNAGTTFTGPNATFGGNAGLYWQQAGTLDGKTMTLGSGASLHLNGTNSALTLGPASMVAGAVTIYSNGSAGSAITNEGAITHTTGSGSIYAPTFTHAGSIMATAGTLYLGYPNTYNSANTSTGTVTADGSGTAVYVRGNFANSGTLTAQNAGVLYFDGTNTSGNLGSVQLATGGRALLNGTIVIATLTAPTGGSFELYGGTISDGTIVAGAHQRHEQHFSSTMKPRPNPAIRPVRGLPVAFGSDFSISEQAERTARRNSAADAE